MNDSLVIIPTYNEKDNITLIIEAIFNQKKDFDILIVDDNSPDGTSGIVKDLISKYPDRLFLENRKGKLGLGTAYIHGFKWGLQRKYDYLLEMDADFSHNPKDVIKLYEACAKDGHDMAIGSRYLNNKISVVDWDFKRIALSFMASKYVRMITGIPIHDTTAGFVCFKRNVLEKINFDEIKAVGYAFQIEMKFKTWMHGFSIKEVSVVFTDRIHGESKMDGSIIKEAIFGVIKMKLRGLPKK